MQRYANRYGLQWAKAEKNLIGEMIKQLKTMQILKSYDAANFDEMSEAV